MYSLLILFETERETADSFNFFSTCDEKRTKLTECLGNVNVCCWVQPNSWS